MAKTKSSLEKPDSFIDKWSVVHSRLGDELGIITNQTTVPDKNGSPRYSILLTHFRYHREPWKSYVTPYFHTFPASEITTLDQVPNSVKMTSVINGMIEEQKQLLAPKKSRRGKNEN